MRKRTIFMTLPPLLIGTEWNETWEGMRGDWHEERHQNWQLCAGLSFVTLGPCIRPCYNKAGYTATLVACGWAGAATKSKVWPTHGWTDQQTDRAGCRVACTRLKTFSFKRDKIATFYHTVLERSEALMCLLTYSFLPSFLLLSIPPSLDSSHYGLMNE